MADKTLASLTAAPPATGGLIYGTQGGADRKFTLSAVGAALIEAATAADQRTALSAGYSLTGSDATSMFDLSGTWNTSGTPTALKLNLTDTASDAASLLMDLQVGESSKFKVNKHGVVSMNGDPNGTIGYRPDVQMTMISNVSANNIVAVMGVSSSGISMSAASSLAWTNDSPASTSDVFLRRGSGAVLQMGTNHATTPTGQALKAHDVTTGTGASMTIAGGTGSVAKGNVVLDGGNRAAYDASPSATTIRDILISHGLMAAS